MQTGRFGVESTISLPIASVNPTAPICTDDSWHAEPARISGVLGASALREVEPHACEHLDRSHEKVAHT